VGLALLFISGMWFGLIYRRWNMIGLLIFAAAQVTLGVAAMVAATQARAWPAIGHWTNPRILTLAPPAESRRTSQGMHSQRTGSTRRNRPCHLTSPSMVWDSLPNGSIPGQAPRLGAHYGPARSSGNES
jgi:hypothetical protein